MNSKDYMIHSAQQESGLLAKAQRIVREDKIRKAMEHFLLTGRSHAMKVFNESKYLKHQELDGQDWVVTIRDVERHSMDGKDGKKENKFVLFFKEHDKGMILNATNMKMLNKLFNSDESDDWKGKRITIYTKDDIEMGGEIMSGLRVRAKLPAAV